MVFFSSCGAIAEIVPRLPFYEVFRSLTIPDTHTHTSDRTPRRSVHSFVEAATYITSTRDKQPCLQLDSNPQFQQSDGCRSAPQISRPSGSAHHGFTEPKSTLPISLHILTLLLQRLILSVRFVPSIWLRQRV